MFFRKPLTSSFSIKTKKNPKNFRSLKFGLLSEYQLFISSKWQKTTTEHFKIRQKFMHPSDKYTMNLKFSLRQEVHLSQFESWWSRILNIHNTSVEDGDFWSVICGSNIDWREHSRAVGRWWFLWREQSAEKRWSLLSQRSPAGPLGSAEEKIRSRYNWWWKKLERKKRETDLFLLVSFPTSRWTSPAVAITCSPVSWTNTWTQASAWFRSFSPSTSAGMSCAVEKGRW